MEPIAASGRTPTSSCWASPAQERRPWPCSWPPRATRWPTSRWCKVQHHSRPILQSCAAPRCNKCMQGSAALLCLRTYSIILLNVSELPLTANSGWLKLLISMCPNVQFVLVLLSVLPLCVLPPAILPLITALLPLLQGLEIPQELYDFDQSRVVALVLDPDVLVAIRKKRAAQMGLNERSATYVDVEVRAACCLGARLALGLGATCAALW